ncbi:MAG: PAS domain S-box protein [Ignavibacteriaceae bacterium]|nr:PAS domain S-box protein [Ignavibacteriaceae bacterium]
MISKMILIDLIYNLSVLVALSILSGFIDTRYSRTTVQGKMLQGILFGAVAIIGMMYPFKFLTGIIFDGRSVVISLCSLFFGPISGLISTIMALGFRVYLGGGGMTMGILVISASFIIGVYFHFRNLKEKFVLTRFNLYSFGFIVTAVMIALMLTLPTPAIKKTFEIVAFTVLLAYPLITMLIGKILLDHKKNSELLSSLKNEKQLYENTLSAIAQGVITTDSNLKITYINPFAEELLLVNKQIAINAPISEVISFFDDARNKLDIPFFHHLEKKKDFIKLDENLSIKSGKSDIIPITMMYDVKNKSYSNPSGLVIVFTDNREAKLNQTLLQSRLELLEYSVTHSRNEIIDKSINIVHALSGSELVVLYKLDSETEKFVIHKVSNLTEDNLYYKNIEHILPSLETSYFSSIKYFNSPESLKDVADIFKGKIKIEKMMIYPYSGYKNNSYIIVLFNKKTDYNYKDAHILTYMTDIIKLLIEKKDSLEALSESMKNFEEIFNSTSDAIFIHDAITGEIIDCNLTTVKMFEFSSKHEIINGGLSLISSEEPRFDKNIAFKKIQKSLSEGFQVFEWKSRKKNGTLFWTEVSLKSTEIGGNGRVLAVVRDISKRKSAEVELTKKINELEFFNKFMVNRELKMIDLKSEIDGLRKQLNLPPKYSGST